MPSRFDRCRRFYEDPLRVICLQAALLVALTLAFEERRWLALVAGLPGQGLCLAVFVALLFERRPAGEQGALARFELRTTMALAGAMLLETFFRLLDWRLPAATFALGIGGVGTFLGLGLTKGPRRQRLGRERLFDARASAHGSAVLAMPLIALTPFEAPWFGVVAALLALATLAGALLALQRAHAETWRHRVRRRESDAPLLAREWPLLAAAVFVLGVGGLRLAASPLAALLAAAPACLFLVAVPVVLAFRNEPPPRESGTGRRRPVRGATIRIEDGRGHDAQQIFAERPDLGAETHRLLSEVLGRALRVEAEELSIAPLDSGVELRSVVDGVERVEDTLTDDEADRLAAGLHLLTEGVRPFTAASQPVHVSFSEVVRLRPSYTQRVLLLEDLGLPSDALERWKSLLRADGLFVVCGPGAATTISASLFVRGAREDDPCKAVGAAWEQTVLLRGASRRVEDVPRELAAAEAAPQLLRAGIVQALVRRACPDCRRAAAPDPAVLKALALQSPPDPWYVTSGCDACAGIGYRGRTGLFEFATFRRGEPEGIVRTLFDEGLYKARQGLSTCAEILRVLGPRR